MAGVTSIRASFHRARHQEELSAPFAEAPGSWICPHLRH